MKGFLRSRTHASAVVATFAMMAPLRSRAEGVPHGDSHAHSQSRPVAPLPLVLGGATLNVAALIATVCPPHPAQVLSCGRGGAALLLALLDGHHALYKVRARLEDRGMFPFLPPGLRRTSLHDSRLGQSLDGLCAATLHRLFGAVTLKAREVSAPSPPCFLG